MGGNYVPFSRGSERIVFPHVATVARWNTWFGFINIGDFEEELDLTVYDACGNLLTTERWILEPGEKVEDDRFTGIFPSKGASVSINARSGREVLIGYLRYQGPPATAAALVAVDGPAEEMYLSHVASSGGWWTGIAVHNSGESIADVVFTAYDAGGQVLSSTTRFLGLNENFVSMVVALFPAEYAPEIASLGINGGPGSTLSGLFIYGSADGEVLSGAPLSSPQAGACCIPQVLSSDSFWEGLAAVQLGPDRQSVQFDLMDGEGQLIRRVFRDMNPGERFLGMMTQLFGRTFLDHATYVRINAGGVPVSGVYLQGSIDGKDFPETPWLWSVSNIQYGNEKIT